MGPVSRVPGSSRLLQGWRRDPTPRLFDLAALVLLVWSTGLLADVARHIGQTYGGFFWIHDLTMDPPYYVSFFPWRITGSAPFQLHALDHLHSIQGEVPDRYPQIYASLAPGTPVRYVVERGDQILEILEPARIFSWDVFAVVFGLPYTMTLTTLWAGRVLVHTGRRTHRRVLGWLTVLAAVAMTHFLWAMDSFDGPPIPSSYWFSPMVLPVPGLSGVMVFHSMLVYARPHSLTGRRPWLLAGLYLPPLAMGVVSRLAIPNGPPARPVFLAMLQGSFLYGILGMAMGGGLILRMWPEMRRRWGPSERKATRSLLLIVGILVGGLLGLWWLPFLLTGWPLVPYEVLIAMGVIFPLGLVYALGNGELLRETERKAQEAEALRRSREQMLHRIADQLHDRVLSDLQGVRMLVESLPLEDLQARQDRDEAVRALRRLVEEVRAILDTTKPMDWSHQSLGEMLAWLARRMEQFYPRARIRPDCSTYDEADPPRVKEAIYHVLLAALNNALIHGQAHRVWIRLGVHQGTVCLEVEDDGQGFHPERVSGLGQRRRHMGLEIMQAHAQEVGGTLEVHSRPGTGTRIRLCVPRGDRSGPVDGSMTVQEAPP